MEKTRLGKTSEVPLGCGKLFVVPGRTILVVNIAGAHKAYRNFCPHMGGSLRCEGKIIRCSWHGGTFATDSGVALSGPPEGTSLIAEKIVIEGEDIFLVSEEKPKSLWADDF